MTFTSDQAFVAKSAASALVSSIMFIFGVYAWAPFDLPPLPTVTDRLVFTLQCDVFAFALLVVSYIVLSNQRFLNEEIDGTREPKYRALVVNLRVAQNNLEQCVVLLVGHLALTTVIAEQSMRIIPILVAWFLLARLAFWWGYHRSYLHRAFGMAATQFPNYLLVFYVAYRVAVSAL